MSKHGWLVMCSMRSLELSTGHPISLPEEWSGVMPIFRLKKDAQKFSRDMNRKYEIVKVKFRDQPRITLEERY